MDESLRYNRPFRLLWAGTLAVRLGSQIATIAITWLVLKTTGSGTMIGITLALYAVSDMLASPFIGVLLDRLPRKPLLSLDNIFQAVIFFILAGLYARGHLPFLLMLPLVIVSGALTPLAYLGRMIILPNLIDPMQWESANALLQVNMNLVTLLGPALGGVLIAAIGLDATLIVTASCYLIYFVALTLMPGKSFESGSRKRAESLLEDVLIGWRFLRRVPLLLILVIVTLLFSLTYGPLEPALPVLVHSIFHEGARALGFLWSAFALGALSGTLLWARLRPAWTLRIVVAAIVSLWGLFSGALSIAPNFWVSAVLLALGGFSYAPYNILFSVWRQRLVPDELRGRVFGAINSVTGVGLPLGQALGGVLLALVGVHWTLAIGGLACIILGAACYGARQFWQEPGAQAEVS
ncbi:MAG: hypothetical protein C7B45_16310 [Sulfobacillus acidophilus]|uniref:Major facilitator superfamily (MFS) profile domain-containing protein n=1 Tax=Sulfobacillus acidophilus TaxID=53633 RepID=A0A2T2WD15_9FIRM|nr:MAG: hypothetical protein C7B45_16310 [Sulfobacillus acidophilus]